VERSRLRRFGILATGWILIGIGILGLFLPFLQGILLILLGLWVLSLESRWARRMLVRVRRRYPRIDRRFGDFKNRMAGRFGTAKKKKAPEPGRGPAIGHADGESVDQSDSVAGMKTGSSEPRSTTDA
jgi:hypothetical protein